MQWGLFFCFSGKFPEKLDCLFQKTMHDLHRIAAMINQPKSQLTSRIIKQHVETNRKILEILNFSSFLFFFLEIVKSLRPKQDLKYSNKCF